LIQINVEMSQANLCWRCSAAVFCILMLGALVWLAGIGIRFELL
jgi:hypothetical protein